jgi:hypothetical protein
MRFSLGQLPTVQNSERGDGFCNAADCAALPVGPLTPDPALKPDAALDPTEPLEP